MSGLTRSSPSYLIQVPKWSSAAKQIFAVWLSRCQGGAKLLLLEGKSKAVPPKPKRIQFLTRVLQLMVTSMILVEEWAITQEGMAVQMLVAPEFLGAAWLVILEVLSDPAVIRLMVATMSDASGPASSSTSTLAVLEGEWLSTEEF